MGRAYVAGAAMVVDDHALIRQAMQLLLDDSFGFEHVHVAPDLDSALQLARDVPSLALAVIDLAMPGIAGPPGIEAFHTAFPETTIVVLSGTTDASTIAAARASGATTFVSKASTPEEIETAIRDALAQASAAPTASGITADASPAITPRQRDMLACLARGLSTKEICREVGLAEGTVKIHLAGLYRNLGARNRTEAALKAQQLGIHPRG